MRHPFSPGAMAVVLFALWGLPGVDPPARGALGSARASHVGRLHNYRSRSRPGRWSAAGGGRPGKAVRASPAAAHQAVEDCPCSRTFLAASRQGPPLPRRSAVQRTAPRGSESGGAAGSPAAVDGTTPDLSTKRSPGWWDPGPASSGSRPVPGRASPPWPAASGVLCGQGAPRWR